MKIRLLIVALSPGLLLGLALSSPAPAAEQQKSQAAKSERWKTQPQKDKTRPATNPCAQYGDGFVQLPGTTTCVRASGSILMEMGTRTR